MHHHSFKHKFCGATYLLLCFFVVVALFFKFNFSHYLMCMLGFLFACLCTSLMPGKHRGQEMVSEPLDLELQSVVNFFTYWKGKLGVVEECSLFLTAKVFSNANFLFLVVFPVQSSLVWVRHLIKKWNSPLGERFILRLGRAP